MRLNGDIVRLVRSNLKMPQKEFAQKLNISQSYLCRIEHGSRVITPEVEARIRKEFAVDDLIISVLTVAAHVVKEGEEKQRCILWFTTYVSTTHV